MGAVLQFERKPDGREPAPVAFVPSTKQPPRVPREDTAAKIESILKAADGPLPSVKIAAALGLGRNSGSYRRALEYARDQGKIAVHEGRGWQAA